MSNKQYIARQGDCISSIASKNGYLWETLWEHPDNAELKKRRKDPNILLPDDIVVIPERRIKEYSRGTEEIHEFVLHTRLTKTTLRLLQDGEPRESVSYNFRCGNFFAEGKSDSDGYLTFQVPASVTNGALTVIDKHNATETFNINIGHLDPIEEITGVQKRLKNLGFKCKETGKSDDATNSAVSAFREKHKLEGEGIDDKLRDKLKTIHGS
jgi:hypothetical protein